jgi:hypothetical protein
MSNDSTAYVKEKNQVTDEEILALVPGLSVSPSSIRGIQVLFEDDVLVTRPVSERRVAARKRRQRIEREKAGLFASQVALEQGDPREEVEQFDARLAKRVTALDTGAREKWIVNLRRLASKEPLDQSKLVAAWNACESPKDHAYFAGWLTRAEERGLAQKVTDRSDIQDLEVRAIVERMDKTWRTLVDIKRAARPDSKFNIAEIRLSEELAKYQVLGVSPPDYVSDKPTWEQLQKEKEERVAKDLEELRQHKEMASRDLLFPVYELKAVLKGSSAEPSTS